MEPRVAVPETAGHYAGTTSQGEPISFDVVSDGSAVTNILLAFDAACLQPVKLGITEAPIAITGLFPVSAGGRFGGTVRARDATVAIHGAFDGVGRASGSLRVEAVMVYRGTPRPCSSGPVRWNARLATPAY